MRVHQVHSLSLSLSLSRGTYEDVVVLHGQLPAAATDHVGPSREALEVDALEQSRRHLLLHSVLHVVARGGSGHGALGLLDQLHARHLTQQPHLGRVGAVSGFQQSRAERGHPTGREMISSPTLQTLQDPILLPPWALLSRRLSKPKAGARQDAPTEREGGRACGVAPSPLALAGPNPDPNPDPNPNPNPNPGKPSHAMGRSAYEMARPVRSLLVSLTSVSAPCQERRRFDRGP